MPSCIHSEELDKPWGHNEGHRVYSMVPVNTAVLEKSGP